MSFAGIKKPKVWMIPLAGPVAGTCAIFVGRWYAFLAGIQPDGKDLIFYAVMSTCIAPIAVAVVWGSN